MESAGCSEPSGCSVESDGCSVESAGCSVESAAFSPLLPGVPQETIVATENKAKRIIAASPFFNVVIISRLNRFRL